MATEKKKLNESGTPTKGPLYYYSSLTYVLIFAVIGIPLWWKTTAVYRVSLPYREIAELSTQEIQQSINVNVLLMEPSMSNETFHTLLTTQCGLQDAEYPGKNKFLYNWNVKKATELEIIAVFVAKSVKDLDAAMDYIFPQTAHVTLVILPKPTSKGKRTLTRDKNLYLEFSSDLEGLAKKAVHTVRNYGVKEHILKRVFISPSSQERVMPEKERMRPLSSAPEFDVTFTLVVPEPHVLDVSWDIERALKAYMDPFLDKLALLVKVNVKSQMLFLTSLDVESHFDKTRQIHVLSSDKLPLIINPIEGHIGFQASVNPVVNFVVYVTSQAYHPLHIFDEQGKQLESNAFLSPKWGGFLFYNVDEFPNNGTMPYPVEVDMHRVFEVFLAQLRLLLGLPDTTGTDDELATAGVNCTNMEIDFLLRRRTQDYLSISISSLHSLSQLLSTISNIVIRDDIGELIYSSVDAAKRSLDDFKKGDLLGAFKGAESAFVNSERAFFDSSLLALLYFPDDQKYAIYIPLFLPMSIPVLLSLRHLFSYYYKRRAERKSLKVD
ncbi:GPI transamidase component PIG-S-like [Ornithodoros turicata]|uniref:GPI transamidase component PIG-S-like n=1 Tax=Ornithodoros turicata TaxID=34597 RepID=UPI003138D847